MKILNFIIIFLFSSLLFGQNLELEYSGVLRQKLPDEVKEDILKDNEYGREQVKMNEEPDPAYYRMLIGDKESNFIYIEKINNDQDPDKPVIIQSPGGFGNTYHNLEKNETRQEFDVYGKKYYSVDPLKEFNWKITKETKEILDFEVRKATSENEEASIIAWYAPKINISNGPAEYNGLPGLILEVEFQSKQFPVSINYKAESIKVLNKKPKIIIPDKGEKISANAVQGLFDEANKQREEMYRNSQGVDKD